MRSTLIEELKIRRDEIDDKIREIQEILERYEEEGESIDQLLDQYGTLDSPAIVPIKTKLKREAKGLPKGDMSWDDYAIAIAKERGGRIKSNEAIEYAKAANLRIKEKTITDSLRIALSKLGKNGILGVEKAAIKSEGNVYYVK